MEKQHTITITLNEATYRELGMLAAAADKPIEEVIEYLLTRTITAFHEDGLDEHLDGGEF